METITEQDARIMAYYYACGRNDVDGQEFVSPTEFSYYYSSHVAQFNRRKITIRMSVQGAFQSYKEFRAALTNDRML